MKCAKLLVLVVLCTNLSENKELKNAIPKSHIKIKACCTDLSLIFLLLFILWNFFLFLFVAKGVALKIYKEFCKKTWVKCEPKLPPHIWFYAKNMCQMRKTKIEVRANITIYVDAREAIWLTVDDWCGKMTDIVNSNKEVDIDFTNIELIKFGI